MPPSVFYTFKKYLHLVRLNWPALNEDIEENFSVFDYQDEQGLYSAYLRASDYVHLFARNTVIIICSALVIFAVWAIVGILDRVAVKRKKNGQYRHSWSSYRCFRSRNEPYVNNFMLRFFYELFLEICICALVNIALTDFDDFSPGLQWIISCIVLGGIFVYLCWLISLFCCKGPYLDGFYEKGTAMSYFWSTRSVNMKYNASEKLKKIQFERAKRRR